MPAEKLAGRLLVATPVLKDPNFERAVVLVVAHEEAGSLGVVLNRATEIPVSDVLEDWQHLAAEPGVVFEGGPVQPEAAICLARVKSGTELPFFSRVDGVVGTLDLTVEPSELAHHIDRLRIFAGYAGWDAEQIESEIDEGAWLVLDALPGDPFAQQPEDLWSMVLRRQGGLLSALALYPADPSLN